MGLYRRGKVWWMTFTYQGHQVRATTGQADRRVAEMVLGETRRQLHDGAYQVLQEQRTRTFGELMDRFLTEHAAKSQLPFYRGLCAAVASILWEPDAAR